MIMQMKYSKIFDGNYPYTVAHRPTNILCILGILVFLTICSFIYYLKYNKAWGIGRHFPDIFKHKPKTPKLNSDRLKTKNKVIEIYALTFVSITATLNPPVRQDTP